MTIHHGDCIEVLRTLPDASVDSVVTDPPYGLEFMGKEWDKLQTAQWRGEREKWQDGLVENHIAHRLSKGPRYGNEPAAMQDWHNAWATEALRLLKPGGHLLAFGGTRTWHRLACAIEDAGFEVRDSIAWLYGSGFPKSLDVSKAIDKAAGAERDRVPYFGGIASGSGNYGGGGKVHAGSKVGPAPATPAAQQWQGWGTALKPAFEPVVVARKPLIGTVAANVLEHGVGGLNIDGCRIGTDQVGWGGGGSALHEGGLSREGGYARPTTGRWPANVILDEDQAEVLDGQSGVTSSRASAGRNGSDDGGTTWNLQRAADEVRGHDDTGGASRFFYCPKAPASERPKVDGIAHPTVKPLALMRYLCRLVTPPGGVILEPFAGSGTTVEAALLEGFNIIAIEREAEYLPLIQARLDRIKEETDGQLDFTMT